MKTQVDKQIVRFNNDIELLPMNVDGKERLGPDATPLVNIRYLEDSSYYLEYPPEDPE